MGDLSKAGSLRSSFPMTTNPLREEWVEKDALVKITHLSASWVFDRDKLVLQNITFEINKVIIYALYSDFELLLVFYVSFHPRTPHFWLSLVLWVQEK